MASKVKFTGCGEYQGTLTLQKRSYSAMRSLLLKRWLCFVALALLAGGTQAQFTLKPSSTFGGAAAGGSSVVTTPHVQAELVAHAPDGVAPGKPLWLGLQLIHQPDWHTYWHNPGDSGLPTQLQWSLPAGLDAGEIAWPLPRKIPIGHLANYGYEGTVLLPVPITVASTFEAGTLTPDLRIQLHATWLVCKQECIPEEGQFTLQLPWQSTTALHANAFAAAAAAQPQAWTVAEGSSAQVEDGQLLLNVQGLPDAWHGQTLEVFAETPSVIETAADVSQQWQGGTWQASVPLSTYRSASPNPVPLVLGQGERGVHIQLPLSGAWPQMAPAASVSPALQAALDAPLPMQPAAPAKGLWLLALGGALLGGLLLNLMPCVFPVLTIKIVGFARHADNHRAHRIGGLAYTAGVVLSFVLLGAAMLALRAAGEAVGWGFQLQSPTVVALLAVLFTVIGLNLGGLFEFGSMLPAALANFQARHPVADAFCTGVLAVAVASPCTAPFMGASLGITATLPAMQALAIFVALGVGLALPYLLASWLPGFARALPRPGAWMQTLRHATAFPMFATVVWLVWVLGQQSGIDAVAVLLALLVLLAMSLWTLTLRGRVRWCLASGALAACVALLWLWGGKILEHSSSPAQTVAASALWQPWQPDVPEQLLAQGQPVFIDYTAAWCITCQYNKQTALANADVLQDFAAKNVALLRADWTRRDANITAALTQLGRSGVPVYVLHAPGRAAVVFSEILDVDTLRAAIAQL